MSAMTLSTSRAPARPAPGFTPRAPARAQARPHRCPGGECDEDSLAARARVEERFGHDFGRVPLHAASRAVPDQRPDRKPPDVEQEDDEFQGAEAVGREPVPPGEREDLPHQGSATIVCNGSGGYRAHLGWAATFGCGIESCVRDHEQSHITDWVGRWPNGCKNADGTSKPDGTRVPTGGDGYDAVLRRSECTAYTGEVPCEERLVAGASAECRPRLQAVLDDTKRQKTAYCGA